VAFLFFLVTGGCGSDIPKLVGKYEGKLEMPPSLLNDPIKKIAASRLLSEKATLDLNADKTFRMYLGAEMTGNWSIKRGQIRLDMVSIAGRTLEDEIKRNKLVNPGLDEEAVRRRAKEETFLLLDYSDDFKTVTFRDKDMPEVKVVFTRNQAD
jgi:hypothetical protein